MITMKKQERKDELNDARESSGGGWEIVYSGFILILLCFFIMLSSFSTMEEAKIMRFVRSFVSAVSIFQGGEKIDSGTAVVPQSPDIIDNRHKLAQVFAELTELADRHKLGADIDISYSAKGLVMRLADHALFDVGVAKISPKATPMLKKIGAIIARTTYKIQIEGHTDNLPIKTPQFPSNWELSTSRAVNVLRYLIENNMIASNRLSAVGFGEFQPIAPNISAENRAKNRRVEIIFLNPDKNDSSAGEES